MFTTHQVSNSYLSELQQRAEAQRRYHSFFQHQSMSLATYYNIFKTNLRSMKEVDCRLPKVKDVATSFILGLCDIRYNELKNQLANATHFNMSQPQDLQAAYALASNYQSIQRETHSRNIMFAEKGNIKQNNNHYHSTNHSIGNKNHQHNRFRGHQHGKPSSTQHSPSPGNNNTPNHYTSNKNSSYTQHSPSPGTNKHLLQCNYCGKKNHTEDKCFKKKRETKAAEANLVELDLPDLSTELEYEFNMVTTEDVTDASSETVILDSGAQISIFNNSNLLVNTRDSPNTINVNGISKHIQTISTNTIGNLPGLDKIPIYFAPTVKRNILSFNDAMTYYKVSWNEEEQSFTVTTESQQFVFKNNFNLFTREFETRENLLTTVQRNMSKLSQNEVKKAELAREIQQRLGYE